MTDPEIESKSVMRRKKIMEESKREDKYWICGKCADKRKWAPPKYGVTMIRGLCGYCDCDDEVLLTPICDYKRPGVAGQVIWD